jgi:hypothetical protein
MWATPVRLADLRTNGGCTRDIAFAPNGDIYVRYKWHGGTGNAAGVRLFTREDDATFSDAGQFVSMDRGRAAASPPSPMSR